MHARLARAFFKTKAAVSDFVFDEEEQQQHISFSCRNCEFCLPSHHFDPNLVTSLPESDSFILLTTNALMDPTEDETDGKDSQNDENPLASNRSAIEERAYLSPNDRDTSDSLCVTSSSLGLQSQESRNPVLASSDSADSTDEEFEKRLSIATASTLEHLRYSLPNVQGASLFCPQCAGDLKENIEGPASSSSADSPRPPPLIQSRRNLPANAAFSTSISLTPSLFSSLRLSLKDSTGELSNVSVDDGFFLSLFQQRHSGLSSKRSDDSAAVHLQGAPKFAEAVKLSLKQLVDDTRVGRPKMLELGILREKRERDNGASDGTDDDFQFRIVSTEFVCQV